MVIAGNNGQLSLSRSQGIHNLTERTESLAFDIAAEMFLNNIHKTAVMLLPAKQGNFQFGIQESAGCQNLAPDFGNDIFGKISFMRPQQAFNRSGFPSQRISNDIGFRLLFDQLRPLHQQLIHPGINFIYALLQFGIFLFRHRFTFSLLLRPGDIF